MFRVCLFGGEIWWMENYEEKMERKTFRSMFGWVEREENKWWNPGVFSLGPPKSFLPKMERKLKRKIGHLFLDKNSHVRLHMGLSTLLCFTLFPFFLFSFSFLLDVNLGIFSLIPLKNFLPKMERKLKGKFGHHFWTKMPMCNCTWPCLHCSSSFFYLLSFSFSFSFLLDIAFFFFSFFFCFLLWFFFFFRFFFYVILFFV